MMEMTRRRCEFLMFSSLLQVLNAVPVRQRFRRPGRATFANRRPRFPAHRAEGPNEFCLIRASLAPPCLGHGRSRCGRCRGPSGKIPRNLLPTDALPSPAHLRRHQCEIPATSTSAAMLSVIPTKIDSPTHILAIRPIPCRYVGPSSGFAIFDDRQLAIVSGAIDRQKYSGFDSVSAEMVIFVVGSSTLVSTAWVIRASKLKRSTVQRIRGLPAL